MRAIGQLSSGITQAETYLRSLLPFQSHHIKLPVLLGVIVVGGTYTASTAYYFVHDLIRTFINNKKRKKKQEECQESFAALEQRLAKHRLKVFHLIF